MLPGQQGEHIKDLQRNLNSLGYSVDIDGGYGPITTSLIRDFQTKRNIDIDGNCGPQTQAEIAAALSEGWIQTPRRYGASGNYIYQFQQELYSLGYTSISIDGNFGPQTLEILKDYQRQRGLEVDGAGGPMTQRDMRQARALGWRQSGYSEAPAAPPANTNAGNSSSSQSNSSNQSSSSNQNNSSNQSTPPQSGDQYWASHLNPNSQTEKAVGQNQIGTSSQGSSSNQNNSTSQNGGTNQNSGQTIIGDVTPLIEKLKTAVTMEITVMSLKVYEKASTGSKVERILKKGDKITYIEAVKSGSTTWYKTVNNTWVIYSTSTKTNMVAYTETKCLPGNYVTIKANVPVRTQPSDKYPIIWPISGSEWPVGSKVRIDKTFYNDVGNIWGMTVEGNAIWMPNLKLDEGAPQKTEPVKTANFGVAPMTISSSVHSDYIDSDNGLSYWYYPCESKALSDWCGCQCRTKDCIYNSYCTKERGLLHLHGCTKAHLHYSEGTNFHSGLDISAPNAVKVYAAQNGEVHKMVESSNGRGKYIVLKHEIYGSVYYSIYQELSEFDKSMYEGKPVVAGAVIAKTGSNHLHFEIQKGVFLPDTLGRTDVVVNTNPYNLSNFNDSTRNLQWHCGNIYYCKDENEFNQKTSGR